LKKPKSWLYDTLAREILDSGKGVTSKMPEAMALQKGNGISISNASRGTNLHMCHRSP